MIKPCKEKRGHLSHYPGKGREYVCPGVRVPGMVVVSPRSDQSNG